MPKRDLPSMVLIAGALVLNVLFAFAAIDLFLPKFEMLGQNAAAELVERSVPRIPGELVFAPRVSLAPGSFWVFWSALTVIGATTLRRRPEVLAPFAYCGGISLLTLATFGVVNPAVRSALLTAGQLFSV